jgi:hypothetical protein
MYFLILFINGLLIPLLPYCHTDFTNGVLVAKTLGFFLKINANMQALRGIYKICRILRGQQGWSFLLGHSEQSGASCFIYKQEDSATI